MVLSSFNLDVSKIKINDMASLLIAKSVLFKEFRSCNFTHLFASSNSCWTSLSINSYRSQIGVSKISAISKSEF